MFTIDLPLPSMVCFAVLARITPALSLVIRRQRHSNSFFLSLVHSLASRRKFNPCKIRALRTLSHDTEEVPSSCTQSVTKPSWRTVSTEPIIRGGPASRGTSPGSNSGGFLHLAAKSDELNHFVSHSCTKHGVGVGNLLMVNHPLSGVSDPRHHRGARTPRSGILLLPQTYNPNRPICSIIHRHRGISSGGPSTWAPGFHFGGRIL